MTEHNKIPLWRRALRRVVTVSLTLVVVAGSAAAVVLGSDQLAERAETTGPTDRATPTPVAVTRLALEDGYDLPRRFVGQVEAAASVDLSFELGGRLSALLVDEGAAVRAGQVLARLDTALLEADRDRLEASRSAVAAQLLLAESRLARAEALREGGHVSVEAVDQARATRDELASRMQETDAALASVGISLEKSVLYAPFAGRVGRRGVDGGETLAAGTPVLTLIETEAPEVRIGLPLSIDAARLQNATIAVNGEAYPATLARVRPDIDPVTRTRTALFVLATDDPLTFGQTATLQLDTRVAARGTWVPLDALQEGAGGGWTLLVVEEGVVRVAMVEVLHAAETRAYVAGTFAPGALMIRSGAHRVVPGQHVQILTDGDGE
ncbi:efflux RND transporter periplasmic adaptor subunit [Cognatishimia sp. F0-27]|uniref:efflux RND transporter periplasmic adaptor subunit n=1 Tax=Cognatishimia sp. F0-27 TaxID=2816855 RepID=UPI001D0C2E9E|nr:efflux RND transporter periplasmic adaptor subunit [Cognatishimia sp. F0-27]MCC1492967.1 efflux RND transporter periplasmic adaptor subunit [Cognatishimia sp. F0-27]